MGSKQWMIYGAYGYSGKLIVAEAVRTGMKPVLAGRSRQKLEALAGEWDLPYRAFSLDDGAAVGRELKGMALVLHCAGPFSATARPMMDGCLAAGAHYLDITGEIDVFELGFSNHERAVEAGAVCCPGVGFDVIPTDCVAASLKSALPDATHLALGFDSRSSFSPGTAKTSVEGLAKGGRVRRNGRLETVPLAYGVRRIDFGDGEKTAVTIPWGDVSTAFHSTGIPNIEVYIPSSPKMISRMKMLRYLRPFLGLGLVQGFLKGRIEKKVRGPSDQRRARAVTHVWGEVRNESGGKRTARIQTANGYDVTAAGSVRIAKHLLENEGQAGFMTPSKLMGAEFVETLPGSGSIQIQ